MDSQLIASARCLAFLAQIGKRIVQAAVKLRRVPGISQLTHDLDLYLEGDHTEIEMYIDFVHADKGYVFWLSTELAADTWTINASLKQKVSTSASLEVIANVPLQSGESYEAWEKSLDKTASKLFLWVDKFPVFPTI